MNPIDYLNSQKGIVSEGIKKAVLAEIPVIYVVTNEISLVYDILEDKQIIDTEFVGDSPADGIFKQSPESIIKFISGPKKKNVFFSEKELLEWLKEPSFPVVSLLYMPPPTSDGQPHDQLLNSCLCQFVQFYQKCRPLPSNDFALSLASSTVIVVTPSMPSIPLSIIPYSRIIKVPPVQGKELLKNISELVRDIDGEKLDADGLIPDREYLQKLSMNLRGLSQKKIRDIFITLKDEFGFVHVDSTNKETLNQIIGTIQKEKELLIEHSGVLKLEKQADVRIEAMTGMKEWLKESREAMKDPDFAKHYAGLRPLKGVLVSGIPGSGKSLMAKSIAAELNLPLVSLSMGLIMAGLVGESEHRLEDAIQLIEALSPCVVWIDEIEKELSGSNSGESDGGTARRMLAQFLKWMQEKETRNVSCFVFATANDISSLPPELFRSGRFDNKFYTFMPSLRECELIFQSLIGRQSELFDKSLFLPITEEDTEEEKRQKLEKGFFYGILNKFHERHESSCKFLTGADIDTLIEMSKKKIYHKLFDENGVFKGNQNEEHIFYKTEEFKEAIEESLSGLRCYGETNMRDIARCFIEMARMNFNPAGDRFIEPGLLDLNTSKLAEPPKSIDNQYDRNLYKQLDKYVSEELEIQDGLRKRGLK